MQDKLRSAAIIQFLLLFFSLFLVPDMIDYHIDRSQIKLMLALTIFATFVHFYSVRRDSNFARFDVFFILGFFIVNFQWATMIAISDRSPEMVSAYFSKGQYMCYAVWLSSIALISWYLGYQLNRRTTISRSISKYCLGPTPNLTNIFKILSVATFCLFLATVGKEFLSGVYRGARNWEGISVYIYTVMIVCVKISIICTVFSLKANFGFRKLLRPSELWFIAFIATFCCVFLVLGDRGPVIQISLLSLILAGTLLSPVSKRFLLAVVILGAIIMLIVSLGRNSGEDAITAGAERLEISSGYDLTIELATSARTIIYSIEDVLHNGLSYGRLMLNDILGVIPLGQKVFLDLTSFSSLEISSSKHLTLLIRGANTISGTGTSFVADIYHAFGLMGVVMLPLLHGFIISNLEASTKKNGFGVSLLFFSVLCSSSIYIPRDSFFGVLRECIWMLLIYFSINFLWKVLAKSLRSPV